MSQKPEVKKSKTISGSTKQKEGRSARKQGQPMLVEFAWEVCNKVGGIYQVLRSKSKAMLNEWGSQRYLLVGPYIADAAAVEFEPMPLTGAVGDAVAMLREWGIEAHYGKWLVAGRPRVVLLNHLSAFARLHEVKYRLWKDHNIALPEGDELLNNVAAFGEVCRLFLQAMAQRTAGRRPMLAHFHEWMAGAAIPMLRHEQWPGSIVFTTHATMLGRYLAMNDPNFYDNLPFYDPGGEAKLYNIVPQYELERAAAHASQVFTTVSDITALECKYLLGRDPDVHLPNGLNIERFAVLHEFQNLHRQYKQRIHEFTIGHFFPSYHFDLDRTIYFFTSGRYEYRNKGMDVTIEALARLNHRLATAGSKVTVVCFIVTKKASRSIDVTTLQSSAMIDEFKSTINDIKERFGEKLFLAAVSGGIPDLNTLVDEASILRLRRALHGWRRSLPPGIVTHDIYDDHSDEVLNQLRTAQLWNQRSNPVKVIYHPDFISPSNPLFGMEYEQFVRGCHLGIFPSYYEPWGYTPLESIALGVPAVTSDLSGFGSYLMKEHEDQSKRGIHVLHRRGKSFHEASDELANYMFDFTQHDRRGRIGMRNRVEAFSVNFDWEKLGVHYKKAHELALSRMS